jgi:hypothetical protein
MDTNLILSIVQIVAVSIIPLIVWVLGNHYQDRKAKNDAKLNVFLTLMANRKSAAITKEWADSLNVIDVVFQDDRKVREAWKAYHDSLNNKSPHFASNNSYMLDLLSEMALSLGYKDLKQTEIDSFYNPQQFVDQNQMHNELMTENLRILRHSKNLAEPYTDEEYNKLYPKEE